MKCNIAKDLLSLYSEELCSAETSAELEKHLEECENCRKQLEHYRAEITTKSEEKTDGEKLSPMKKVSKKLKRNKLLNIVLTFVIIVIALGIGVLSYGEITNKSVSFSLIADYFKLRSVSEQLAEGNTQPLVDVIALVSDNYYGASRISSFDSPRQYKEHLKQKMDRAYADIFGGKDITVKAGGLMPNGYEADLDSWGYNDVYSSYISFEFWNGGTHLITLDFAKIKNGQYMVFEYDNNTDGKTIVGDMLPADNILMEICMRSTVRRKYESILISDENADTGSNGWKLFIDGVYGEDNTNYGEQLTERVKSMYSGNFIVKDAMYSLDHFDDEAEMWVYKVWMEYENLESGSSCITEYSFYYHNNNFFVIPGYEPRVISSEGVISPEEKEMMVKMF